MSRMILHSRVTLLNTLANRDTVLPSNCPQNFVGTVPFSHNKNAKKRFRSVLGTSLHQYGRGETIRFEVGLISKTSFHFFRILLHFYHSAELKCGRIPRKMSIMKISKQNSFLPALLTNLPVQFCQGA